jgi:hypothetical protein
LFFVTTFSFIDAQPIYSKPQNGIDVININTPGNSLAFGSNLALDNAETGNSRTIYFMADKSSPNIYSGGFQIPGGEGTFWVNPGTTLNHPNIAPYFSFDVYQKNFFGPAYPINSSIIEPRNIATFILQFVTITGNNVVSVTQKAFPGFTFLSALIDPRPDPVMLGFNPVYIIGWSSFDLVPLRLFRGFINLGSFTPMIELNIINETLGVTTTYPCYDQFTESLKPQLNLTLDGKLIVLVPGRCGLLAKINLILGTPLSQLPLGSISRFWPPQVVQSQQYYISSIIYDYFNNLIFYTLKQYNVPGASLYSFRADTWLLNPDAYQLDLQESEAVLVLGNEIPGPTSIKYLFVIASGSDRIQRYNIDENHTVSAAATNVLTPDINRISSAYYYYPYIYYITYEPDAKVVRIPKTSFCNKWCGLNGYCEQGICYCSTGYTRDESNPTTPCQLTALVDSELQEKQSQGAAAALGVLFAFSLVAAIAGWYLWWRGKRTSAERIPIASNIGQNL